MGNFNEFLDEHVVNWQQIDTFGSSFRTVLRIFFFLLYIIVRILRMDIQSAWNLCDYFTEQLTTVFTQSISVKIYEDIGELRLYRMIET